MMIETEGFGLFSAKEEGAGVYYDSLSTGPRQGSETTWVELCYNPDDKVAGHLYSALVRSIDTSIFNDATKEDIEKVITKLAYQYCR